MHSKRPSRTAQSCKRFAQNSEPAQVRECVADQLYVWSAAEVDKHNAAKKQAAMVDILIMVNRSREKRNIERVGIAKILLWAAGGYFQDSFFLGICNPHFNELN